MTDIEVFKGNPPALLARLVYLASIPGGSKVIDMVFLTARKGEYIIGYH